jgi:16S rRNA (guanine966-N2)-methyltransferase
VREAWFSILGDLTGQRVVDIYAGTGALGIEALSRGAASAVFVEAERTAIVALTHNVREFALDEQAVVLKLRAERARAALEQRGPYDLILTDPPWTELYASIRTLARLLSPALLATDARVVIGHPRSLGELTLPSSCGLNAIQTRNWGDSAATFFELDPSVTT